MKKELLAIVIIIILIGIGAILYLTQNEKLSILFNKNCPDCQQEQQIQAIIDRRRQQTLESATIDPFGEDGLIKILFVGLDNRIGETKGHCDAIQFIEINKNKQTISITAVPRGTYSPLPGQGYLPTDYYIAKACEVAGLDYGIKQIEKVLGQKADFVIFLGFSEAMGIFRQLQLPANETMQWLRQRQGYAIGEPQRARNHSTFIKQMIIKFTPEINTSYATPIKYLIYKLIKTDLSFQQIQIIADAIAKIDATNNPQRIQLLMRPAYEVKDIQYDPTNLNEKINALIKPIAKIIPEGAYTGETEEAAQLKLIQTIENDIADQEFVKWAYHNYLWLQIEAAGQRELAHYNILTAYIALLEDSTEKEQILADYIIEMQDLGKDDWAEKGKELIKLQQ
jgi:anionic cell wall polymer biosynthesis LytR-Cps2A-Psr (LCP) family protein